MKTTRKGSPKNGAPRAPHNTQPKPLPKYPYLESSKQRRWRHDPTPHSAPPLSSFSALFQDRSKKQNSKIHRFWGVMDRNKFASFPYLKMHQNALDFMSFSSSQKGCLIPAPYNFDAIVSRSWSTFSRIFRPWPHLWRKKTKYLKQKRPFLWIQGWRSTMTAIGAKGGGLAAKKVWFFMLFCALFTAYALKNQWKSRFNFNKIHAKSRFFNVFSLFKCSFFPDFSSCVIVERQPWIHNFGFYVVLILQ